jgi:hypothetical protein
VKKGDPPPNCPPEAILPEPPLRPRIRVADATTEKLGYLAAHHERGLLLSRDELAGWLGAFDRYGGGGGADRAFALEMYGWRSYAVDRSVGTGIRRRHFNRPQSLSQLQVAGAFCSLGALHWLHLRYRQRPAICRIRAS